MKKKLPTKVMICGRTFRIYYHSGEGGCGGHFDCGAGIIRISAGGAPDDLIYQILVHEVVESILTERNLRFAIMTGMDEHQNMGLRFVMDHQQFEDAAKDIATAFKSIKEAL